MLKSYPAIFHKKKRWKPWGLNFRVLVVETEGSDVEEAMKNAREMLKNSLSCLL